MSNVHIVVKGDSLSKISKTYGVPISELKNINHLPNPNKLEIGQHIMLKKEDVLGFQVLILDKDRNPIEGLAYHLESVGLMIKGITGADGLSKQVMTVSPQDKVRILVERMDKSLKEIVAVTSGYGNKLVTLVSPSIKIKAKTEKHPDVKRGHLPNKHDKPAPIHDPKAKQPPTTDKKDLGPKVTPTKTPDGKPLTKVEGDIPDLDFLDEYNGEVMAESDYEWAAKELGVEKAAIKAFAIVESGNSGFYKIGKRNFPKILYERHKFSRKTNHAYSAKYPDISLPNAYYNAKAKYVFADAEYKKQHGVPNDIEYYRPIRTTGKHKDNEEVQASSVTLADMLKSGKATVERDKYADVPGSYKRLVKAYQLNQIAALESCSWGAFQIMGEYWSIMGYASAKEFTKEMSRSPKDQIKAFVRYIEHVNPGIKKNLKSHDWAHVAAAYNGAGYKDNNYDMKLEAAYKKYKDE